MHAKSGKRILFEMLKCFKMALDNFEKNVGSLKRIESVVFSSAS